MTHRQWVPRIGDLVVLPDGVRHAIVIEVEDRPRIQIYLGDGGSRPVREEDVRPVFFEAPTVNSNFAGILRTTLRGDFPHPEPGPRPRLRLTPEQAATFGIKVPPQLRGFVLEVADFGEDHTV